MQRLLDRGFIDEVGLRMQVDQVPTRMGQHQYRPATKLMLGPPGFLISRCLTLKGNSLLPGQSTGQSNHGVNSGAMPSDDFHKSEKNSLIRNR